MAGFVNVAAVATANDEGRIHTAHWRKVPSQASVAGWWVDLSMAAGNPVPNYYAAAPLEAKALDGFDGIFHGDDKAPASKHLLKFGLVTPTAGLVGQYTLCDYLLFYPFIDGDAAGEVQPLDNTTAELTRYTDGAGVQVMAVAVAPTTGSGTFTFDYTNQDGVARTSPTQVCTTTAANIASIATSQQAVAGAPGGPFLLLASGDAGVRSIESVTFVNPNGGLLALVLVKPLIDLPIREINTANEVNLLAHRPGLPVIEDGAYLNLIMNCAATVAAGLLAGFATFIWSD
jgi:hypothetical protein